MTDDRFTADNKADRSFLLGALGHGVVARIEDEASRWRGILIERTDEQLRQEKLGIRMAMPRTDRVQAVMENRTHAINAVLQQRGLDPDA